MMKRARILAAALALLCAAPAARAEAATIAFGYLVNRSKDANYDYLETIFPNSFASSIRSTYRVSVITPSRIGRILARDGLSLEKEYRPHELADLTGRIGADYFVYGSFVAMPDDRIRVIINLYCNGLNRIFSFSTVGKLELELFRLVDRVTAVMIDFLGKENLYLSRIIPKGSKLGIVTNLEGAQLNYLYCALINGGYRVASIQGNSLDNGLAAGMMESFSCIETPENSYRRVSDPRAVRFLHGAWTGKRYYEEITYTREAYRIYDTGYTAAKFGALDRLAARHGIDTLLIIGFNRAGNRAWVRCLDLKTRDLIWTQSNIRGTLPGICAAMLGRMGSELTRK